MSEVQNPVEEQPAAPVEDTSVVEPTTEAKAEDTVAPAAEETTTATEPAKDEEPAAAAEAPATTTKAATPKEFTSEGTLGYKAPGNFLKKFLFQKHYFWFGSEPVETKKLASYLRGEKPEIANHNAAWSSQTGKGLLYFSKTAGEKANPAGIINLADITDVTEDGTVDFFFYSHGAKHVFEASISSERESWVAAIKTKSAEAKEMADGIKSSEGYKEQKSSLSKSAGAVAPVAAVAALTKESETKKEEKAETKEEKKEEKARKSRSASRKRNSIFGSFGIGSKKDEPTETKEDKKVEAKDAAPAEVATTEPVTTEPTAAPLDGPAVAAPVVDEPAKTDVETHKPANKRNSSIFASFPKFGQKKSGSEAKPSEAAPAAKDATAVEPVSAEAPVIPAPEASEPLATAIASPAPVPVTEVTNGVTETEEAKPEVKPETKTEAPQKRKSSLPFGLGKLRQTIRGRSSHKATEKAAEKAPEKTDETAAEPAAEPATGPASEEPAITSEATEISTEPNIPEPISAAPAAATQVSATA